MQTMYLVPFNRDAHHLPRLTLQGVFFSLPAVVQPAVAADGEGFLCDGLITLVFLASALDGERFFLDLELEFDLGFGRTLRLALDPLGTRRSRARRFARRPVASPLAVTATGSHRAVVFHLAVGAGVELHTVGFPLAVRAGVAVRAVAFRLPVRAGGALCAVVFPLAVRAGGAALSAPDFHLAVRAGGAYSAAALPPAVGAAVAVRAAAFHLAVRTGVACHTVAFQLPVRAGVAGRALAFQLAVGARVARRAEAFHLAVRAGGARRAVAFRLSVRVSLSFSHSYTRRPPRVPLLVRPRRRRCFSRSTFFGCSQNSDFLKSSKTHPRNRHPPHTPPRACLRPFASLRDVARRCREVRRKSNVPVRIPMTKICALRTPNASGGKT